MTGSSTNSHRLKPLRRVVQSLVLLAAVGLGLSFARGWLTGSVERVCPMGGLATLYSVVGIRQFTCATGELNLVGLLAVVALALAFRKSFCGWICPVGFVHEGLARVGRAMRVTRAVPISKDGAVRVVRAGVLLAILVLTAVTAELVFRPLCPYYVMSSFHGHEVALWSYAVMLALVGGALVIPMFFCRYLCPLGGFLWPLARCSATRIARDSQRCVGCGSCDKACLHGLCPSTRAAVVSGECTECLACVEACPERDALFLTVGRRSRAVTRWLVPSGMAGLVLVAGVASPLFEFPSYERSYVAADDAETGEVELIVDGVRCVDTAERMADQLDGQPGILELTAYAARHRVLITYDRTVTDPKRIIRAIEAPVFDPTQGRYLFHIFRVLEVDDLEPSEESP